MEENAVQPQAEVKVFEGSSGGILKTMEDMEGDLTESREKSEYEESDERHAYDMEQDELTHAIEVAESGRPGRAELLAKKGRIVGGVGCPPNCRTSGKPRGSSDLFSGKLRPFPIDEAALRCRCSG